MFIPVEHNDPINHRILSVSEDMVDGFHPYPFDVIAERSGIELVIVLERVRAMLKAGIIRRVRQTLLATKLAEGALVAWKFPEDRVAQAFDFMASKDPFSGHVVIRSTDTEIAGSGYKLWTTLKVPCGQSLDEHAGLLQKILGAETYTLMPAHGVFALGVGHVRRRSLPPGSRLEEPAKMMTTKNAKLDSEEWKVLLAIKEELSLEEIQRDVWFGRAARIGLSFESFCRVAKQLEDKKVIGRFSTFLEHKKKPTSGKSVTKFNGLFHWAVPKGYEERVGAEVGRHHCMTHAYWREAGAEFGNVNIMGVIHGLDKSLILEHKKAIDSHLEKCGIPVTYTAVFWGGRSEIKPSEINPKIYKEWHERWDHIAESSSANMLRVSL